MSYVQAGLRGAARGLMEGGLCFLAVPALAPVAGTYALIRAGIGISRNIAAEHNTEGAPPQGTPERQQSNQARQIIMQGMEAQKPPEGKSPWDWSGGSEVATA